MAIVIPVSIVCLEAAHLCQHVWYNATIHANLYASHTDNDHGNVMGNAHAHFTDRCVECDAPLVSISMIRPQQHTTSRELYCNVLDTIIRENIVWQNTRLDFYRIVPGSFAIHSLRGDIRRSIVIPTINSDRKLLFTP